ncbi:MULTISPECIES: AbrB/MazE/SpoVT family DNA-binding domain-containing protein [unclassified Neorhizobium]|uniref:AbrB/MazE/SpoVT family DNA-binding domain-containing protein n=1 Tax=unclassified Neorhizobium TaxID=2629175 RepID=UPI001FF35723|nr:MULTISPECIES: AbrB/MazE/SpoVT family DNA-binding domain-containing protein [unclassified Neorhizobium]MCJ9669306.1 AbrB/MazE/SpoVT family DNA-binding domain-containing protein [Neorhizobium sp. SHOUNA12B]MCJ9743774.1 AbrB/MazE/SpoVT family DNA-binding domain-containing protein [Neorhizobium sp. SHOUNA12A]
MNAKSTVQKITIQKIGEDHGIALPQDILHRLGWKEGQVLELHIDDTGIELFDPKTISDEDFQRQFLAAKMAMRKYHVALSALAKS